VHLRERQVTERAHRAVPSGEAIVMATAAWAMATPRRFRLAELALRLGRLLRRGGRIRRLPPPLSAWTDARDLPVPPDQTFRQWWRASGRPGGEDR
jgi:L-lactate dehydrogenase complex protein LldF